MMNLQKDIVITDEAEFDSLCIDVADGKCDLFYQKIYLETEKGKVLINQNIFNRIKGIAKNGKQLEFFNNFEALNIYYQYIALIQELFHDLKIRNELETALLIRSLIKNGYFSSKGKFVSKSVHSDNIKYFNGINIILGQGCCRDFASFYVDIFAKIFNHNLTFCGITSNMAERSNHIVNLIKYEDALYGYDIANDSLLTFESKYRMHAIDNSYFVEYRSFWDVFFSEYNFEQIRDHINEFGLTTTSFISNQEYFRLQKELLKEIYRRNSNLLKCFDKSTKQIKEKVKEKLL